MQARVFDRISQRMVIFFQARLALPTGMGWLCIALFAGIIVRSYFLVQPMRGDEAYTFLVFANHGVAALFDYSAPNNHVLNTLLIRLLTQLWGGSPAIIRFPAFLASLAAIPLVFHLARALVPWKHAGVLTAGGVAIFPYLVLYGTNARGYSLLVLCTLLLAVGGFRLVQRGPAWQDSVLLALPAALGMFAIPVMLFPLTGLFCWLVCLLWIRKSSFKEMIFRFALPFSFSTVLFTLVFYSPVIYVSHGLEPLISNKFVAPQSWSDFRLQLFPQLQHSFDELVRDVPVGALIAILVLALIGAYGSLKSRHWAALLLLPLLLLGATLVLVFQHTVPYARTWIYLLPFVLLVADLGLAFLLENLPEGLGASVKIALALGMLFFVVNLMSANIIALYPDTSAFPEAPVAVEYLKPFLEPGDRVRMTSTADWSVNYYFWAKGVLLQPGDNGRVFYIVKKSRGSIEEMTGRPVIKLFEMGDMAIYQGQK